MLNKFEVEDFPKWKAGFMAAESLKTAAGAISAHAFQGADNPKLAIVLTEWDELEKAKAYFQSPALQEALRKSGVLSIPEFFELKSI